MFTTERPASGCKIDTKSSIKRATEVRLWLRRESLKVLIRLVID